MWIPTAEAEDLSVFATEISVELFARASVSRGEVWKKDKLCICNSILGKNIQQEALRVGPIVLIPEATEELGRVFCSSNGLNIIPVIGRSLDVNS